MTQPPHDSQDPWENPGGGSPPQNPYGQGRPPPPHGGDYAGGGYGQQGGWGYGSGEIPPYSGGPEQFGQPPIVPTIAAKWKRLVGILIDWLIFIVLDCLFALPNRDVVETDADNKVTYHFDQLWSGGQALATLLSLVLAFLYFWLLTYRWNGQTLGKKAMGTRVVREDTGGPVDSKTAAARSIVFVLLSQICCFTILVDAIWIFTNPKNQTLHDKAAGTVVVDAGGPNPYQQGGHGQGSRPY
jgi:uncharacterized RDD family membrane protein YckC